MLLWDFCAIWLVPQIGSPLTLYPRCWRNIYLKSVWDTVYKYVVRGFCKEPHLKSVWDTVYKYVVRGFCKEPRQPHVCFPRKILPVSYGTRYERGEAGERFGSGD